MLFKKTKEVKVTEYQTFNSEKYHDAIDKFFEEQGYNNPEHQKLISDYFKIIRDSIQFPNKIET